MLFRKEVVNRAAITLEGDMLIDPKPSHKVLTIVLVLWVCASSFWLAKSNYSKTQTVTGWVDPPSGVVKIFSTSSDSVVAEIFVANGDLVKKGDLLIELENKRLLVGGSEYGKSLLEKRRGLKEMLTEQKESLAPTLLVQKESLVQETQALEREIESIYAQLKINKNQEEITREEKERFIALYEREVVSLIEMNEVKKEHLDALANSEQTLERLESKKSLLQQTNARALMLKLSYEDELRTIEEKINLLDQEIISTNIDQENVLKSPISGMVTDIQFRLGQRVNNSSLMAILPENEELEINLLVPVKSAGFLKAGQKLNIRYDAFPHEKFGSQVAYITDISNYVLLEPETIIFPVSSELPVYRVKAMLGSTAALNDAQTFHIKAGMTLLADIQLETRTILEWFLDPIFSLSK